MTERYRIIIDDLDRDSEPERPYMLNVFRDDSDGTQSRQDSNPGGQAVIGADIPTMLRELADAWERDPVTYDEETNA